MKVTLEYEFVSFMVNDFSLPVRGNTDPYNTHAFWAFSLC